MVGFEKNLPDAHDEPMGFPEKMQQLMKRDRYSSAARLAQASKVPQQTLSRWLKRGLSDPVLNFMKLARTLGVPAEWLADDSKGWPPPSLKLKLADLKSPAAKAAIRTIIAEALESASEEDRGE